MLIDTTGYWWFTLSCCKYKPLILDKIDLYGMLNQITGTGLYYHWGGSDFTGSDISNILPRGEKKCIMQISPERCYFKVFSHNVVSHIQ